MATRWFFSLHFRLIAAFTLVLALALTGISLYVGYTSGQDTERLERDIDDARLARMNLLVSESYTERRGWEGIQQAIEGVSSLYGWRIRVIDQDRIVRADSHLDFGHFGEFGLKDGHSFPILSRGVTVGSVFVTSPEAPEVSPEPSVSLLTTAVNRSLLWTGLAVGAAGILLISLLSRRMLGPVRELSSAARLLGQGDTSQRVSPRGRDEVAELGRAFNSMASDLEKAEQQRKILMADIAHELRTPLSNVQGYLEAIKDGLLQPDARTIDTVHEQVIQLARLVEDLRLLALAEAGDLPLHRQPGSLVDVLQRSMDGVKPRADASGVQLLLEAPEALPPVELDSMRIAQVVGNLLENAISYTPEGGQVTVTASLSDSGLARVTVADTGIGIPEEDLPSIFERFYRVDPSRTRATGAAGLGLTIAKGLVEAHGGAIYAESSPGQGSRFTFELPLTSDQSS